MPSQGRRVTANIGMVLFLASWAMMFITLFFSYGVIRTKAAVWPPLDAAPLPVGLAWVNSGVLLASSVVFGVGERRLREGAHHAFARSLACTIGLGLLFLGLQVVLWQRVHADGLSLSGSLYGSWVYLMTVFHAAHIVVGLGLLFALVPAAVGGRLHPDRQIRVHLSGMFWHFLGVAWLGIFVSLFLV